MLALNASGENESYDIYSDYYEKSKESFEIDWPWGNHTNSLTWRWLISPKLIARTFLANSRYRFNFGLGVGQAGSFRMGSETGVFEEAASGAGAPALLRTAARAAAC